MNAEADRLWRIRDTLANRGFAPRDQSTLNFVGQIEVGHRLVDVELQILDLDFVQLPRVHLLNRKQIEWPTLGHQQVETGICYGHRGHYNLDPDDPGGAVLRVLDDAAAALLESSGGAGITEVAREYGAYWGLTEVPLLEPAHSDAVYRAFERVGIDGTKHLILSSNERPPSGYNDLKMAYSTLPIAGSLKPTDSIQVPDNLLELRIWLNELGVPESSIDDAIKFAICQDGGVILSGENGKYGARAVLPDSIRVARFRREADRVAHVMAREQEVGLIRFTASEGDLSGVVRRSLEKGHNTLVGKRCCIVGCGAIGGHLAKQLAQLGAGCEEQMMLVDYDLVTTGNIGRHLVGFDSIGSPKVDAVKHELQRYHPNVDIATFKSSAERVIGSILTADLVVDATGVENISLYLSQEVRRRRQAGASIALFHSFLFGYGVSAWSFADLVNSGACYRCLRQDSSGPWRDDPFRKNVELQMLPQDTGCGDGVFLPYGPYASIAASAQTAQHVHDWAKGVHQSSLRTLLLDPKRGREVGNKSPSVNDQCPRCRSKS